jgi:hypothetical protein
LNRPASICSIENSDASVSDYCAENPGVLALWPGLDGAAVSKPFRPTPPAKALFSNLINAQGIAARDSSENITVKQKNIIFLQKKLLTGR